MKGVLNQDSIQELVSRIRNGAELLSYEEWLHALEEYGLHQTEEAALAAAEG
ncbi:hypothetical protein [Gorillibacterium sp. sgz5001074]|uniref:hypothetical protein n=1 Tax=Gorillibacterium sp. sgz5001074 TaxID=3446695 RepID=UPI003F676329